MRRKLTGLLLALAASTAAQAAVIDFDDNYLAPDSFFDPQANTSWTSGDASFSHGWNEDFNCCWSGATYTNQSDTTTAGFLNDRSAITGDGFGAGQDNYAVLTSGIDDPQINFASRQTVQGAYFTNTTYAYLAMAYGDDGNADPYVKGPFVEGDFLKLTVTALGGSGQAPTSLEFLLADGANVIDDWTWFDMSALGEVNGLSFSLSSSDNGQFGMNTPAYFAVDSISIVPVPAAVWMFMSGLGLLGLRSRRKA
jgi:hypothetical protein